MNAFRKLYLQYLWEAESLEVLRPCEAATCVAIFYSAVLVLRLPLLYELDDNKQFLFYPALRLLGFIFYNLKCETFTIKFICLG